VNDKMMRKLFTLAALALVAVAFGAGSAAAANHNPPANPGSHFSGEGFSDGRLGA